MEYLYALSYIVLLKNIYNVDKKLAKPFPSPGLISGIIIALYYGLPSFINTINPELSIRNREYYGYSLEIYEETSLIGIVSIISLYIGYYIFIKYSKKKYSAKIINKIELSYAKIRYSKIINFSFAFSLIGMCAVLYKQYLGLNHYGGVLNVNERGLDFTNRTLSILSYLTIFGLSNLIFLYKKNEIKGVKKILFFFILIYEFSNAIFSGGVASLVQLILPFTIFIIYYDYFKINNKGVILNIFNLKNSLLLILFFCAAFIFKELSRSMLKDGVNISLIGILNSILEYNFLDLIWVGISKAFSENLIATLTGADSMAVIITRLNTGYQSLELGSTFSLIFISLIPRFLYDDKPDIALGMWFTDNYWRNAEDVLIAGSGTQSTAFLLPGEFYINFGIAGVTLGMVFVGVIIARITKFLFNSKKNIGICSFSYIVMLLFPLVHNIYSLASYFSTLVSLFLINTFLLIFLLILSKIKVKPCKLKGVV